MRVSLCALMSLFLVSSSFAQTVQFRYEAVDDNQNILSQVDIGDSFWLNVYVQDLRGLDDGGVFAAYLNIDFDTSLAMLDGDILYSDQYQNVPSGMLTETGLINVGAVASGSPQQYRSRWAKRR